MNDENQKAALRDLSLFLETQLETVIANQQVLIAMHETLLRLVPKYETEFAISLANPTPPKTGQQDVNLLWTTRAKKTLLALRQ
jgi:hypothetical protein